MNKLPIFFFVISLCFIACTKEPVETFEDNITNNPPSSLIGFDELEVGAEFRYKLFSLESYYDPDNPNYEFSADTLLVEVCGFREGKFVVSEMITEGSAMHSSTENYYHLGADSVYTNYWYVQNDSLIIEEKDAPFPLSHLFIGGAPDLNLNEFTESETEMFGWKITAPYTEYIAEYFIKDGSIAGVQYPHLNVVLNNAAMAADGPGFMYFYNRPDGILRTAQYSAWTSTGIGWERIQD